MIKKLTGPIKVDRTYRNQKNKKSTKMIKSDRSYKPTELIKTPNQKQ